MMPDDDRRRSENSDTDKTEPLADPAVEARLAEQDDVTPAEGGDEWGAIRPGADAAQEADREDDAEPWIEIPDAWAADSDEVVAAFKGDREPTRASSAAAAARPVGSHESPPAAEVDFFDVGEEPFADFRDLQKLGIIGGKGVGKSYLFQAMVYRLQNAKKSGAMSYYIENDSISLMSTLTRESRPRSVNPQRFSANYENWNRLPTTLRMNQTWYRLTLPYRIGIFGTRRAAMEVEFFDGSGESFFEARDPQNKKLWEEAYKGARVMVFCLPLWAAFPGGHLNPGEWRERQRILESFHEVVQNYKDMRRHLGLTEPVRTILALTMADDRRGALDALRENWVASYLEHADSYLMRTRNGKGIARYLANARTVSSLLHEEFDAAHFPGVADIPNLLNLGGGRPWLIPVSAIDGQVLERLEQEYPNPDDRPPQTPPVPIHVELPLLVALCERVNALM